MPFPLSFCSAPAGYSTGGLSLGGITSDPLRVGGGITARGDAVRRPQIVFAAGRRRAGRCECALLVIVLDVGHHRFLFR